MIIFGYPGIGKSTLSRNPKSKALSKYVDLESSLFKNTNDPNWYITYACVAESLSEQGFTVFLSTHPEVIKALDTSKEDKVIITPDIRFEKLWLDKLNIRRVASNSFKDKMAYLRARDHYKDDIGELQKYASRHKDVKLIVITKSNYDLEDILREELL